MSSQEPGMNYFTTVFKFYVLTNYLLVSLSVHVPNQIYSPLLGHFFFYFLKIKGSVSEMNQWSSHSIVKVYLSLGYLFWGASSFVSC